MARVRLHAGAPILAFTPSWGVRDVLGSNGDFLDGKVRSTAAPRAKRAKRKCAWCGTGLPANATLGQRHCARCSALSTVIEDANRYMKRCGLRPLDRSMASRGAEELEHRRAARNAQRKLKAVKVRSTSPKCGKSTKSA